MSKLNWDRVQKENLSIRRDSTFIEPRISRPLVNIFSGVEGGPAERLQTLEKESKTREHELRARQQQELSTQLQKSAIIKSAIQTKSGIISNRGKGLTKTNNQNFGVSNRAFVKRPVVRMAGRLQNQRERAPDLSKAKILLNMVELLTRAIERGDMDTVARLASKIYGEAEDAKYRCVPRLYL